MTTLLAGRQALSDRTPSDRQRLARGQRAGGAAARRLAGGAIWRTVFAGERCAAARSRKLAAGKAGQGAASRRRGSDWNKNFDLKKAPKIWQAAQESGAEQEKPSDGLAKQGWRKWREGKVRPVPGNSPHDRPVSRGFVIVKGEFATIPSAPPDSRSCQDHAGAPGMRFLRHGGIYRSDVVIKAKPNPSRDRPPPVGRPRPRSRTRREDHALLIVRDEFRPAIPRSGCSPALPVSASPARPDYHALPPWQLGKSGHFYFARKRNFYFALTV